ncbi:MAG: response regulator transcription factor [Dehalococcoidia bacterium]|jgi:two-component system, NarL family, invasion response regulator UvrY|nr:response regulator transcription factor [Dehalococcoidia bacterium]
MSSVRLLIADDHAVVRQGIRQILTDAPEVQIVAEAATGMEALELMRDADVDLVILDLSMPGLSGLDIVRQMRQDRPLVRILVLSVHPEEQYAVRVMKAGASGYLTKDSAPEELISAVRHIATGHKYVTATLAERLALELDNAGDRLPHQSLSDREYEVMLLVAEGLKVQEIADRLSLSVKTVSTYRTRLLQKMRMRNNADVVRYAVREGLVDA